MPPKPIIQDKATEELESLLEVLGETQTQILAKLDKLRCKHGPLSQELEERLLMLCLAREITIPLTISRIAS